MVAKRMPSSRPSPDDRGRMKSPPHPGKRLARLLLERGITAYRCATDMGVQKPRIYELAKCQGAVSPALALRLGLYFGDGPETWMAEQARFDLALQAREIRAQLKAITPLPGGQDDRENA